MNSELQNVGLNSLSFVRVVVEIEKCFEIEFPDERLSIEQADTVRQLCEIVMEMKDKEERN